MHTIIILCRLQVDRYLRVELLEKTDNISPKSIIKRQLRLMGTSRRVGFEMCECI